MESPLPEQEGFVDYDLNGRTRNNTAKLIVNNYNTSVGLCFFPNTIHNTFYLNKSTKYNWNNNKNTHGFCYMLASNLVIVNQAIG